MTAILVAIAASLIAAASVKYALDQRAARVNAERDLAESERKRADFLVKLEAIQHAKTEQKARVDTGDPAADFSGSLDVLSDLSAKRRK